MGDCPKSPLNRFRLQDLPLGDQAAWIQSRIAIESGVVGKLIYLACRPGSLTRTPLAR